jgi:predicted dehydrogenase
MVHHVYLTLALLGSPDVVYGSRMRPAWTEHREDDQAWMTWEFDRRTSAHLFASFAVGDDTADPWTFVVKVLGTKGGGCYSWRSAFVRRALGTLSFGIPAYEDSYIHEVRAFVDAIGGDPSSIASTMDDALDAARILEQVVGVADEGGRLESPARR